MRRENMKRHESALNRNDAQKVDFCKSGGCFYFSSFSSAVTNHALFLMTLMFLMF